MRKKMLYHCFFGFIVSFFVLLLPQRANASEILKAVPNAKIEYEYSEEVTAGTIRYVCQKAQRTQYYHSEYWEPYNASVATSYCNNAVASMALSYVGVNRTAGQIHVTNSFSNQGALLKQLDSVSEAMENLINGNGKYSPVILHWPAERGDSQHWVLAAGKLSENTYLIVDPVGSPTTWKAVIEGNKITALDTVWMKSEVHSIDRIYQYYNSSAVIVPDKEPEAAFLSKIDEFITRCYKIALKRNPDEGGFKFWKEQIEGKKQIGSTLVYEFVFSKEYLSFNKSNEDFVEDLYEMFLGRKAEPDGFSYWVDLLNKGTSREEVFEGFANSDEFFAICQSYGIMAGYFSCKFDIQRVNDVNFFTQRLYETCLGRWGDKQGQAFWVSGLLQGTYGAVSCAESFVNSQEYVNKGLSDEQYVENLYLSFMGRTYDEGGKKGWMEALEKKTMSRNDVFRGFAYSEEFANICASYGMVRETK